MRKHRSATELSEQPFGSDELHDIRNKKRPRAIRNKKKGGVRLGRKRMSRTRKAIAAVSGVLVVSLAAFGVNALFQKDNPLVIDSGYGSVVYALEEGETYSASSSLTGEQIFGRLNWKFRTHEMWSADVQGEVHAAGVADQDVKTFKRYSDGILISADVTQSAFVNAAREFCYVEELDRVVWREAAGGSSTYNGLDTPWNTGDPVAEGGGNIYINYHEDLNNNGKLDEGEDLNGNGKLDIGFKATRGLPAYELSVYVIRPETILSERVEENADGTFTLYLDLDPEIETLEDGTSRGATTYYRNQMKFTGGLASLPSFKEIHASFTFDSEYNTVRTNIREAYSALGAPCSASSQTDYDYISDVSGQVRDIYESYFETYMQMEATGTVDGEPDAFGCLSQAFAPLLSNPTVLELDLTLDGKPVRGTVYLDLGMGGEETGGDGLGMAEKILSSADIRAKIGSVELYLTKGEAYLSTNNLKVRLDANELFDMISGLLPEGEPAAAAETPSEEGEEQTDLLDQLKNGTFVYDAETGVASLDSDLSLAGISVPLSFRFRIGENGAELIDVDTSLSLADYPISANLRFGDLASAPAPVSEEKKAEHADLMPYVNGLVDLFTSEAVRATVDYNGIVGVHGVLDVALKGGVRVAGNLSVSAGENEKDISFSYENGVVYLNLGGVKLSADGKEAIELISQYLPKGEGGSFDVRALLNQLFDGSVGKLIEQFGEKKEEGKNALVLAADGTGLLKLFGADFDLGTLTLSVAENSISLEGALKGDALSLRVEKGETPQTDTENYTEIIPFAKAAAELLSKKNLKAELTYGGGGLTVNGTVNFTLKPLAAKANISLHYGEIDRELTVQYAEDALYLSIDTLCIRLGTKEAISLVKDLVGTEGNADASEIIEKVLGLDFVSLLTLTSDGDTLTLALQGTELLNAFNLSFDLGEVKLSVAEGEISASAEKLGLSIALRKGEKFSLDTKNAVDFTPVVEKIPAVLREQSISLSANLELEANGTEISLIISSACISWKNGISVYLDASLSVGRTAHDITFLLDEKEIALAYGGVGARILRSEISDLGDALLGVYNKIRSLLGEAAEGTENPLPEMGEAGDMLSLLEELIASLGVLSNDSSSDWTGFVQALTVSPSERTGGLLALSAPSFTADIFAETEEELIAAAVTYSSDTFTLSGEVRAAAGGEFPSMPAVQYLGKEDFVDLFDYLAAAIGLLSQEDLNISVGGAVVSSDEAYEGLENKYKIEGNILYHSGGSFPFTINTKEKSVTVNTDLLLQIDLSLTASLETDKGFELKLSILDADKTGAKDGELDFFISVSTVGAGKDGYNPLTLYAPAKEVMTVLSGACAMLGLDIGPVNDYLIAPYLTLEEVGQLKGLGDSLKSMLGDILGASASSESAETAAELATASAFSADAARKGLVTALNIERATSERNGSFTFALDSSALWGIEGPDDISFTVEKSMAEDGTTLLAGLSLSNIWNKAGTEKTSLSVKIGTEKGNIEKPADSADYFSVEAVDTLILALAKSATHPVTDGTVMTGEEEAHAYALNTNFYIDGNATLKLEILNANLEDISIDVIAISVNIDEDGRVGINLRLSYKGVYNIAATVLSSPIIINGDTVLDVTIKESPREGEGLMLYMKRDQSSEFGTLGKHVDIPAHKIVYRALPLSEFMSDYMGHLAFMFNLNQPVIDKIMGMMGGSGGSSAKEPDPADLGGWLDKIVSSCTYRATDVGDEWTLNVNGEKLLGSSFKEMRLTVGTDGENYLRSISAYLNIANIVYVDASLKWHNPGGKMDGGVKDITENIADTLEAAMDAKLATVNWKETGYLEGQLTTVKFMLDSETCLGEQAVVFGADGKPFAKLGYPDLTPYTDDRPGYTPVWEAPEKITPELVLTVKFAPNRYTLEFESERQIPSLPEGYSEEVRDGKYFYTAEWVFGTEIQLPFYEDEFRRIEGFRCPAGTLHIDSDMTLHVYTDETVHFDTVWEEIGYTVEFVADGTVFGTRTGNYGDAVTEPEGIPEKEGYRFVGWDNPPATFESKETVRVNALFEANTYDVTLVSEYQIDGFVKEGEFFVKHDTLTYDTPYVLPSNVKAEGKVLRGFKAENGDTVYGEYLPNVLASSTFTAVWEESGFDITFKDADGNTVGTMNRRSGETVSRDEMPDLGKVEHRDGYTPSWDFDGDTLTVTEERDISVKYTPITYIIYEYSLKAVDGFEEVRGHFDSEGVQGESYWRKIYYYVYDSAPHALTLGVSENVKGYDFDGYYTERFGQGTKITSGLIDNDLIRNVFKFNVGNTDGEGLEGKNVLYANWVDNSVEVLLYSDFSFKGYVGKDNADGYFKTIVKAENDYDISSVTLTPEDGNLVQLGWWYCENGSWRRVTNVSEFRNRDNKVQATVKLFALWAEKIHVRITKLQGNATYDIGGVASGGKIAGVKSSEIFESAGMTRQMVGVYLLCSKGGKEDTLEYGKEFDIVTDEGGGFTSDGMTSFDGLFYGDGKFGGVIVTVRFKAQDGTVLAETTWRSVVSFDTYTVNVHGKDGEIIGTESVRIDYERDTYDNAVYVRDIVDGNSELGLNGYTVPEKDGYTGDWNVDRNMKITGALDIYPNYTARKYAVRFESVNPVPTWELDGDVYYYETEMFFGSVIEYNLASKTTFTVKAEDNKFVLPENIDFGSKNGLWLPPEIDENHAVFTASYQPDKVIYKSAVPFTCEGAESAVTELEAEYSSVYRTVTPAAAGYTFLGWYKRNGEGWEKVETLSVSDDYAETELEALWAKEEWVTFTATRDANGLYLTKENYSASAEVNDAGLIGAWAGEYNQKTARYAFVFNTSNTANYGSYTEQNTASESKRAFTTKHDHAHVKVEIVYTLADGTQYTFTQERHVAW